MKLNHKFVEFIPDKIEEGILYISIDYGTIVHQCPCGCGNEVVTPLTPTDWAFTYNGETISLYPSVGNWQFQCKSHYWIKNGRVKWAEQWSKGEITQGRLQDRSEKDRYYKNREDQSGSNMPPENDQKHRKRWWLFRILFGSEK